MMPSISSLFDPLMTVLPRPLLDVLRRLLLATLKSGPLPRHVGFIMDGNRRFAKSRGVATTQGHREGFEALKRVLENLLHLDIPNVTVYAFAIDNFARPKEEVDLLMSMARSRLAEICGKGELLDRHGVRLRVLGRWDLMPEDVRRSCQEVEAMTAHNTKTRWRTSIRNIVEGAEKGEIDPSTITPATIDDGLFTSPAPPLDILVRTSGVHRLSDFLLWQCNTSTSIHFVSRNWPDFGLLDVLPILVGWQAEEWVRRSTVGLGFWGATNAGGERRKVV